jgi:hypothetical protein
VRVCVVCVYARVFLIRLFTTCKVAAAPGLEKRSTAVGIRCADHVTPLYPQKLVLTSPTGGGRSVGIVRSRTKATEFCFSLVYSQHVPSHSNTTCSNLYFTT